MTLTTTTTFPLRTSSIASSMDENPSVGRSKSVSSTEIGLPSMPKMVLLVMVTSTSALELKDLRIELSWTERLVVRWNLEGLMMERTLEGWPKTVVVQGLAWLIAGWSFHCLDKNMKRRSTCYETSDMKSIDLKTIPWLLMV